MAALEKATFLVLATLCTVIQAFEEKPRSVRSATPSYNASELECFSRRKVLFTDGKCYFLCNKGPCLRGQWLVLSKTPVTLPGGQTRSYPECIQQQCPMALKVYWPEENACLSLRRDKARLCPYKGNRIGVNSWGEGECKCELNHARYEQDVVAGRGTDAEWEGDCYPLYHRGPCSANQIFQTALIDGNRIVGRCASNPCHNSYNKEPGSTFAQLAPNVPCSKLETTGSPCTQAETFGIHPVTMTPSCYVKESEVSMSSLFNTTTRCNGNINLITKECRQKLEIVETYYIPGLDGSKPRKRRTRSKPSK